MKKLLTSLLFFLSALPAFSQTYTVKGKVNDSKGQPVPFASIYQKNTTRGTSANSDGEYLLRLAPGPVDIVFKAIGYRQVERRLNLSSDQNLNIVLEDAVYELKDVVIRAYSDDPANEIMRNAISKRKFHLEEVSQYSADVYIKGVQRLSSAPKKFLGRDIDELGREMGLDSNRAGILYLSESESKLSFMSPDNYREEMVSSRVSGSNRAFSFNRATDMKINFYENMLELEGISNRPFISPLADNAFFYYTFKLIGTGVENGQMVNKIQVIPRRNTDPVFRGEIYILEDSWRIHSADLAATKESNINFVDTLNFRQEFLQVDSRIWMPGSVRFDFVGGIFGFRFNGYYIALFKNYDLSKQFSRDDFKEILNISAMVNKRDSNYWKEARPIPLTEEEKIDYVKKQELATKRESKPYLDSLDNVNNKFKPVRFLIGSGYNHRNRYKREYINFSSVVNSLFYNTVEGVGLNYQVSYTRQIDSANNKYINLTGKVRYGFSNELLNGSFSTTFPMKDNMVTLSGGSDVLDLNNQGSITPLGNSVNSLLYERNLMKLYQKKFVYAGLSRRLGAMRMSFSAEWSDRTHLQNTSSYTIRDLDNREFTSNNPFTPGLDLPLFPVNQAFKVGARLTYNFSNKYSTYPTGRVYAQSKYPTLGINYTKGISGVFGSDVDYDVVSADLSKSDIGMGMYGKSSFWLGAGTFLNNNSVYFTDFRHFVGNKSLSFIPKPNNFLFLDFYENSTAGDFFEAHLQHNFSGFILNKVPLIRKLKLQEIVGFNYLATSNVKNYSEYYVGLQYLTFRVMYGVSRASGSQQDQGIRIAFGF